MNRVGGYRTLPYISITMYLTVAPALKSHLAAVAQDKGRWMLIRLSPGIGVLSGFVAR